MCIRFLTKYPCCDYAVPTYSTHCQSSGRDNVAGNPEICHGVEEGSPRKVDYLCPTHRGLRGPWAGEVVRQPAYNILRHASRDPEIPSHSETSPTRTRKLQQAWAENPNLYEQENPGTDMRGWRAADWRKYRSENVVDNFRGPYTHLRYGAEYEQDRLPWGTERPGGALMNESERQTLEREEIDQVARRVANEMWHPDGTLREGVLEQHRRQFPDSR